MSTHQRNPWRLILSPPASGAENMALDDAVLQAVSTGASPPTLRLYAWDPPCLSIGYAQPIGDVDLQKLEALGWDLVRRPTGGRAILHTDELTYAVISPEHHPDLSGGVLRSYQKLSAGFAAALKGLGLEVTIQPDIKLPEDQRTDPVCFQVPSAYEITAEDKKLIGSAQVRRRGGVLQHGTIPLRGDIARICQVLNYETQTDREEAQQRVREQAATITDLLGRPVDWIDVAQAIKEGFERSLGWTLVEGGLTDHELQTCDSLTTTRYRSQDWNLRI
ncbi:MAG: octanoyltransferase [Anaerolineales bacterium]|nr:octanoyltransferase [Anaerolineales bacterium]